MAANNRRSLPFAMVSFAQSVDLLRKSGVEFCKTVFVENNDEPKALAAAQKIGFPVILKVVSPPTGQAVVHKGREGLVAKAESADSFVVAYRRLAASHARLA